MTRLVKNGSIVLDGTAPKYKKIKQICNKIEKIEDWEEYTGISAIDFLNRFIEGGIWSFHKESRMIGKMEINKPKSKTVKVRRVINEKKLETK